MSEGWYSNSVVYDKNKGGEIMYKSTPDSLVQYISGTTATELFLYWGKYTGSTVTESIIKTLFTKESQPVGTLTGKSYTFISTSTSAYLYWCIPFEPNTGDRIIWSIKTPSNTDTNTYYNGTYQYTYSQSIDGVYPSPAVYYGYSGSRDVTIDGTRYRVYRSLSKYDTETLTHIVKSYA